MGAGVEVMPVGPFRQQPGVRLPANRLFNTLAIDRTILPCAPLRPLGRALGSGGGRQVSLFRLEGCVAGRRSLFALNSKIDRILSDAPYSNSSSDRCASQVSGLDPRRGTDEESQFPSPLSQSAKSGLHWQYDVRANDRGMDQAGTGIRRFRQAASGPSRKGMGA